MRTSRANAAKAPNRSVKVRSSALCPPAQPQQQARASTADPFFARVRRPASPPGLSHGQSLRPRSQSDLVAESDSLAVRIPQARCLASTRSLARATVTTGGQSSSVAGASSTNGTSSQRFRCTPGTPRSVMPARINYRPGALVSCASCYPWESRLAAGSSVGSFTRTISGPGLSCRTRFWCRWPHLGA